MKHHPIPSDPIDDFDDAYANAAHITGSAEFPNRWLQLADDFRKSLPPERLSLDQSYGQEDRMLYDLFKPAKQMKGLVIIVHGGYWMRFDKSYWSHLATGCVDQGYAVAVPSYTLCPAARISDITCQIAELVEHLAEKFSVEIRTAGHSAGGHLVTRLLCAKSPLSPLVQRRIINTVSISGVHDLRPLLNTTLNETLRLDLQEAATESPLLHQPVENTRLTCWVGADERPEFVRQNSLLANLWYGLGAKTAVVESFGEHHFDVIDALQYRDSALVNTLLA